MTTLHRRLPPEHPLHRTLADEVHARPPVNPPSPGAAACVAVFRGEADTEAAELDALRELAAGTDSAIPGEGRRHVVVDLPEARVKWERHSEFSSYTVFRGLGAGQADSLTWPPSAFGAVPEAWLARLPGQTIAAVDVVLVPARHQGALVEWASQLFPSSTLIGSCVAGGVAQVYTDFHLGADGRERWVVFDAGMTRGQQARVVQRLTEIAIYRVMALLAFPAARDLSRILSSAEKRLSEVTARVADLGHSIPDPLDKQQEEGRLLDELTQLAAEVERTVAASSYRFAASRAYWEIVNNRVAELREQRIPGVATVGEFLSRRLAPAMNTVLATAERQQALADRIARTSDLLRTRVDVAREQQNQQILAAMNRRSKLSLRLQQTVEGLSVAAITYYGTGLVGYMAKGLKHAVPGLEPDWITACSVPVLAFLIWRAAHRVRHELFRDHDL
jgi:uncharacterized membrane-anchored protein